MARAATTTDVFNAIAEPRRRELLDELADGERSVNELVERLGVTQPLVSKHLRVLREVGAVRVRDDGRRRLYTRRRERTEADPRLGLQLRADLVRALRRAGHGARRTERKGAERCPTRLTPRKATVTLPADDQILITREFDAPRHLVYQAWTTPELVKRWWAGKRGEVTQAEIDLRVGGTWRYVMTAHGEFEVGFRGEYRELVHNERIVSTEVYEGAPEAESVNTLTLTEHDGRTTMTVLVQHQSKANRDASRGRNGGRDERVARRARAGRPGARLTRARRRVGPVAGS